jgi:hypothetical protein
MPPNTLHDPQHILQKLEDRPCGSITLDLNPPQQGETKFQISGDPGYEGLLVFSLLRQTETSQPHSTLTSGSILLASVTRRVPFAATIDQAQN